jgi:hypothetical protein
MCDLGDCADPICEPKKKTCQYGTDVHTTTPIWYVYVRLSIWRCPATCFLTRRVGSCVSYTDQTEIVVCIARFMSIRLSLASKSRQQILLGSNGHLQGICYRPTCSGCRSPITTNGPFCSCNVGPFLKNHRSYDWQKTKTRRFYIKVVCIYFELLGCNFWNCSWPIWKSLIAPYPHRSRYFQKFIKWIWNLKHILIIPWFILLTCKILERKSLY